MARAGPRVCACGASATRLLAGLCVVAAASDAGTAPALRGGGNATVSLQVLGVARRAGAEAAGAEAARAAAGAGAAKGAADTVVASAAVDGGIDAAVWCSCRPSRGKRVCGGMYYSLKQCNAADACPDACKDRWEPAKIHAPSVVKRKSADQGELVPGLWDLARTRTMATTLAPRART